MRATPYPVFRDGEARARIRAIEASDRAVA
jgi:hypothetical protein